MSTGRHPVTRILYFAAFVFAALALLGYLYFVQIERNEEYQNQLHFRELNEIGTGLSDGLDQLTKVADVSSDALQTSLAIIQSVADQKITSSQTDQAQYNTVAAAEEASWEAQDAVSEAIYNHFDPLLASLEDENDAGLVFAHCSDSEDSKYCEYFTEIFDYMTFSHDWLTVFYEGDEPFPDDLIESWNQLNTQVTIQLDKESQLLQQLAVLSNQQNVSPKTKRPQPLLNTKSEEEAAALCQALAPTYCQLHFSSKSGLLPQIQQQFSRLETLNQQQRQFKQKFDQKWQQVVAIVSLNDSSNSEMKEAFKQALDAHNTLTEAYSDDSFTMDPVRQLWANARLSAIETVEDLLAKQGWGRFKEDNIFSRAATQLNHNIPYQLPEANEEKLALRTFIASFSQQYVPTLVRAQLRQRVRLARGGDTFKHLTLTDSSESNSHSQSGHMLSIKLQPHFVQANMDKLSFSVPTEDLLKQNIDRFPLVLIADQNGTVLARSSNLRNTVDPADLQFKNTKGLFKALSEKQQLKDAAIPQYSGILEQEIGGIAYQLFIQPVTTKKALADKQHLFLLGLVPASEIRFAKLSVSPSTAMWFVLGAVCVMAAVPLLKLRFVSAKYSFSRADISRLGLGSLVLIGVISIGISDQFFLSYFTTSKTQQAEALHKQITSEFSEEVNKIYEYKPLVTGAVNEFDYACQQRFNNSHSVRKQTQGSDYVYFQNCENDNLLILDDESENGTFKYLLEGSFSLDARGLFMSTGESGMMKVDELVTSRWLHTGLFIANDINLNTRRYFQQASLCQYPYLKESESCRDGLAIERIANVRDGRKSTQFAFSEFDNIYDATTSKHTISSIGTRLRTFFARVLPNNFGYIVFENSGRVIYHSEDERALLENIFVETDNNAQLRTLVNFSGHEKKPVSINTLYRDQEHLFVAAPLHEKLPWHLVIYHNKASTLSSNMLLVFISISLFIAVLTPLFLWTRYGTLQHFWRSWVLFDSENNATYVRLAWWGAGLFIFAISTMGVIHALSIRLLVWLLVTVFLINRMNTDFTREYLKKLTLEHPATPFIAAILVTLLVSVPELRTVVWGNSIEDVVALMVGVLALIAFIVIGNRRAKQVKPQLHSHRYSRSYIAYLTGLIWLFGVLPALLVVNSANKYLLHHQAHLDSLHLHAANSQYESEVASYLELMRIDPNGYSKTNWLSESSLRQLYPVLQAKKPMAWVNIGNQQSDAHTDRADVIINKLVTLADIGSDSNANLHYLAKIDHAVQPLFPRLHYDADKFLLAAVLSQGALFIAIFVVLILLTYYWVERLFVQKLMGEHLPDNFRVNDNEKLEQRTQWFIAHFATMKRLRVQLIRSTPQRVLKLFKDEIGTEVFQDQVLDIQSHLEQDKDGFVLAQALQQANSEQPVNVLLSGLDDLAFHAESRQLALALFSELHKQAHLNIVLLCEVAPLFRLCKPDAYPGIAEEALPNQAEMLAWANLLAQFTKEYDWSPSYKEQCPVHPTAEQTLTYESEGWPQLGDIRHTFYRYHNALYGTPLSVEVDNDDINTHWQPSQIVEFFASHAGALYRQKWQQCTKDEKLLLYQVAHGESVNPMNIEVLEHLVRRGYLFRDQGWYLINASFRRFIVSAENKDDIAQWQEAANKSIWQVLKLPILIVVVMLIGLILFSTGEGLESILAILSAMLGLIPVLLRNAGSLSSMSNVNTD